MSDQVIDQNLPRISHALEEIALSLRNIETQLMLIVSNMPSASS